MTQDLVILKHSHCYDLWNGEYSPFPPAKKQKKMRKKEEKYKMSEDRLCYVYL